MPGCPRKLLAGFEHRVGTLRLFSTSCQMWTWTARRDFADVFYLDTMVRKRQTRLVGEA